MKPIFISALMLVCIAFGASLVLVAERYDKQFSPPPDGSVAGSTSAQAHHITSCLDLQRELNRRYPKLKLVEDGICGRATQAAWDEVVFNQYALELWPE